MWIFFYQITYKLQRSLAAQRFIFSFIKNDSSVNYKNSINNYFIYDNNLLYHYVHSFGHIQNIRVITTSCINLN